MPTEAKLDPLDFACEKCGQPPGQPCVYDTLGMTPKQVEKQMDGRSHRIRLRRAQTANRKGGVMTEPKAAPVQSPPAQVAVKALALRIRKFRAQEIEMKRLTGYQADQLMLIADELDALAVPFQAAADATALLNLATAIYADRNETPSVRMLAQDYIRLTASPPVAGSPTCLTCGAPTLKPGERHAKVLPPSTRPEFFADLDDEASAPSAAVAADKGPS